MYTNKTTNYELPIFLGTDKANWGDINIANEKIDTAMKANEAKADNAQLSAEDSIEKATQALAVAQETLGKVNGEAILISKQSNIIPDKTSGAILLRVNANMTLANLYGAYNKSNPTTLPQGTKLVQTDVKPKEDRYVYDLFNVRVTESDGKITSYHIDATWSKDGSIKLESDIRINGATNLTIKTYKILNTSYWWA